MEQQKNKRVIITFGDIKGSGSYSRRAGNVQFNKLIDDLQEVWFSFELRTGSFLKTNGDGFMAVTPLPDGHGCHRVIEVLKLLWEDAEKMRAIVKKSSFPRPDGFRIRMVHGECIERTSKKGLDYVGYEVSMCAKLCKTLRAHDFVVHQSVVELMSPHQRKKHGFVFKKLSLPNDLPEGVDREDGDALWTFAIKKMRRL